MKSINRRQFITQCITATLVASNVHAGPEGELTAERQFYLLEKSMDVRLGVYAINTADGSVVGYRENERFPQCSTFKVMLVAAVLARSDEDDGLLKRAIKYTQEDLVEYSPVTEKHVATGMTVKELCAATLQYSDNSAANFLLKRIGGTEAVTEFARNMGDRKFRLDRNEPDVNTCLPGDERDTTTPMAMAYSLNALYGGAVLSSTATKQLTDWMLGSTTGDKRIRAAVPEDWKVADKTGSGPYGTANDIAIVIPTRAKPIILAVYSTQSVETDKWNDQVIVEASKIAFTHFDKYYNF